MKIVIDTNVFFHDFLLDGTEFRTLFSELPRLGYILCMPQIVFDETVNKFLEETRKVYDSARKIGVSAVQFSKFATPITSPENAKEVYQVYFAENLRKLNAEMIGYPAVTHQKLVERALQRKKPFRSSDTGGYRDALLWETILELAKTDEVMFISNNPKDFSDENKKGFHQDLIDDIQSRELKSISLFTSVHGFNEVKIYPELKNLAEIQKQLKAGEYEGLSLTTFLEEQLTKHLGSQELDPSDLDLPNKFESPSLNLVETVNEISDINVRQLSSGELLITFSAEMECEFHIFIYKPDYYVIGDDIKIFVWDNDWNEWYVAASTSKQVTLDLKLTYLPENEEVTSVSILGIRPKETG
jgi:predicted nucleic acid-binding protein